MPLTLNRNATIFYGTDEPGFELDINPGVIVRPLLRRETGANLDVFDMTIAAGSQIAPEAHPYSETLTVIGGEVQCVIDDEPPVNLSAGHTIHIAPDCQHHIVNTTSADARLLMLIGV